MFFSQALSAGAVLALLLGADGCQAFSFALIGDQEYDAAQAARFPNLREAINADPSIAFVIHDGDIKSGSSPCSDVLFLARRDEFNAFAKPFVYVFGDNEWTDCHRAGAGRYNPLERLAKLRAIFHPYGSPSLGAESLSLERQGRDYPENLRWTQDGAMFVTLNIPGSNDGLASTGNAAWDAANRAEEAIRKRRNLAWLRESFALAQRGGLAGLMLVIQANPWDAIPTSGLTAYQDFLAALEAETRAFGKPVVLVHGDSHYFRIDKPLPTVPFDPQLPTQPMPWENPAPRLENFTRVETFGTVNAHWLKVTVDRDDPSVFTFQQRIVRKNVVPAP